VSTVPAAQAVIDRTAQSSMAIERVLAHPLRRALVQEVAARIAAMRPSMALSRPRAWAR